MDGTATALSIAVDLSAKIPTLCQVSCRRTVPWCSMDGATARTPEVILMAWGGSLGDVAMLPDRRGLLGLLVVARDRDISDETVLKMV